MIQRLIILFLFLVPLKNYAQQQSLRYQIRYKQNKYELSNQNKQTISTISDTLKGKTNYIIYINGHTDSDADSSYNQQLSLKRSLEVKSFLVEKGIDETLIKVQAKGEEQPLVANTTPLEKAKNRRVEIVVLFLQMPREEVIEIKKEMNEPGCNGDTTVILEGGYVLTMSKCDWDKNRQCLRIEKRLSYKFKTKENWLKKHVGFKDYKKGISYEPHYEFYVVACRDSCFQNKMKLYIPQYNARGLNISERYSQKKNDKSQSATLAFKKTKLGDSAYYVADIYCPGTLNCGTDNRCTHDVTLYAKNKITILSYSYYTWNPFFNKDSAKAVIPLNDKRVKEQYRNTFFQTLNILHKGDTIQFKNIPIDIFAHGINKIKTKGSKDDKSYFLFIPYRKRYKCGHFKRYKIRAKDIEHLKHFDIQDLEIEN
ncbi:OmpA family protein [Ferruginibacter sp. SUN106]|uniref:OmpA family protein n=1 Tax=Ferruginibacter sp. SUN106 TaxID=2978348 RepID=UPI003D35EEDB